MMTKEIICLLTIVACDLIQPGLPLKDTQVAWITFRKSIRSCGPGFYTVNVGRTHSTANLLSKRQDEPVSVQQQKPRPDDTKFITSVRYPHL